MFFTWPSEAKKISQNNICYQKKPAASDKHYLQYYLIMEGCSVSLMDSLER